MAVHCSSMFMDEHKQVIPIEGAYAIVDWLLGCMAGVEDNVMTPLCASLQNTMCRQDHKVKEAAQKACDWSQDSKQRKHYQQARDCDSEQSDSDMKVDRMMS